jgi:hypothetical protein
MELTDLIQAGLECAIVMNGLPASNPYCVYFITVQFFVLIPDVNFSGFVPID